MSEPLNALELIVVNEFGIVNSFIPHLENASSPINVKPSDNEILFSLIQL